MVSRLSVGSIAREETRGPEVLAWRVNQANVNTSSASSYLKNLSLTGEPLSGGDLPVFILYVPYLSPRIWVMANS